MNVNMGRMAGLALAATLAVAAVPARAQTPEQDDSGMECVEHRLTSTKAYEVVAEVYLSDDVPEVQVGRATSILDLAARACADQYKWSDSRKASAIDIGLYSSVSAYLIDKLVAAGTGDAAIAALRAAVAAQPEEEFRRFAAQDWRSDLALTRGLRSKALDAGVPDEDEALDMAFQLFELGARRAQSVALFQLDLMQGE